MGNKVDIQKIFRVIIIVLAVAIIGLLLMLYFTNAPKKQVKKENLRTNNEFNNELLVYSGKHNGSTVKNMIDVAVRIIKENGNDASKLIDFKYQTELNGDFEEIFSTVANNNENKISKIKNSIKSKQNYYIDYVYSETTGNIAGIIIKCSDTETTFIPNED